MKELTQINGSMVDLSKELAEKFTENELLKSQLEELNREMNQFTYIVSHDLQAPLRTITGFLELLDRRYGDKLDDSAKQFIDYAVKGAAKMKLLVFDLLEYSRLNTTGQDREEVDMNTLLQELREKYQSRMEETGCILRAEQLPVVTANKKQMAQLIQQLVGNALKFRSAAAPEINITLKKKNDFWEIGVNDNGIGIEEAYFEKIFIVFRRLHTDETKYPGTGIGLALCKKIVELHGGSIRVESRINVGSTFYFTLPVNK